MPARPDGLALPPIAVETIAGLSAGFLSTMCVHPLDLIKVRLQVDRSTASRRFGSSMRIAQDVARKEGAGWKGLYRGLTPNLTGNMVSWGLYFMIYGELKTRLAAHPSRDGHLSGSDYLLTSGAAGALTAICSNPLWVIKTRMLSTAASSPGAYTSFTHGLRTILRTDGAAGLMRGLVPALFGVTHGALQFMFYEELKLWKSGGETGGKGKAGVGEAADVLSSVDFVTLSAAAKVAAGTISYPYRVVQTRMQNFDARAYYRGPADVVAKIAREEGARGFYKGLAPSLARVLPSTCITFLVYENARHYLK
ncbi:mitochondrial carrier domain-containing protein [Geopyxis carbonaria]|nr:mitochondrial carrier domain-containing protein [Geopyxis carbonaria]